MVSSHKNKQNYVTKTENSSPSLKANNALISLLDDNDVISPTKCRFRFLMLKEMRCLYAMGANMNRCLVCTMTRIYSTSFSYIKISLHHPVLLQTNIIDISYLKLVLKLIKLIQCLIYSIRCKLDAKCQFEVITCFHINKQICPRT